MSIEAAAREARYAFFAEIARRLKLQDDLRRASTPYY